MESLAIYKEVISRCMISKLFRKVDTVFLCYIYIYFFKSFLIIVLNSFIFIVHITSLLNSHYTRANELVAEHRIEFLLQRNRPNQTHETPPSPPCPPPVCRDP